MGNEIGSPHNRPANARTLQEAHSTQRRILSEIAFLFDTHALGGSFSWCRAARIALVHCTDRMAVSGVRKYRSALARYMRDGDAYSESEVYAVCGPITDDEREQVAREVYSESAPPPFARMDVFADAEEKRDE